MPSLDELLEESMVFVAARGAGHSMGPTEAQEVSPPSAPQGTVIDDAMAENLAIWHWVADASDRSKIDRLSVITRGMHNSRMKVCQNVLFRDVTVKPPGHAALKLPLKSTFLKRQFHLI